MTRNENSGPEECICEQVAYLPYWRVYPNGSEMNELSEIAREVKNDEKN